MPWFMKPKTQRDSRTRLADEMWIKCQQCHAHVFKQDFINNLSVCTKCNWHGKVTAYERIGMTLDAGTFKELNETIRPCDPLKGPTPKGWNR